MNWLKYLAKQGIAIQGTHGEDNFTHLLKSMATKDSNKQTNKQTSFNKLAKSSPVMTTKWAFR